MAEKYTVRNLLAFIIAPLFILAIPLYDILAGRKKKFTQHLIDIGLSVRETLLTSYFVAFFLGISALLITYSARGWALALSLWIGSAFLGFLHQLKHLPVKILSLVIILCRT